MTPIQWCIRMAFYMFLLWKLCDWSVYQTWHKRRRSAGYWLVAYCAQCGKWIGGVFWHGLIAAVVYELW